jgi:hypothetical protein
MDVLTAIIYLVLFIILMVFVFSMGLLTPIIGQKDILSVLAIGFIVGLVGGLFFITPIYQEIPYAIGSFHENFNVEDEKINIEVSPIVDTDSLLTKLNNTEEVISVLNKGIVIKTDPFPNYRKKIIEEKIPIVDKNFENFSVNETGEIHIFFTKGHDPNAAIKTLADWLMYTGEINTRYSLIYIEITTKPSDVDKIVEFLNSENIAVTSVEGPVESAIEDTKNLMPDNNVAILLCGVIGFIVALISIYLDEIVPAIKKFILKIRKR